MPRHNLPCSVFPHPDSRAAAFPAKRLAIFVLAYGMGNTIRNSKVLPINAHVEDWMFNTSERVGILFNVLFN